MIEPTQINTKIDLKGSAFKKYLKNTSWMFSEKAVRLLVNFFVGIFVVRYLGAERNGILAFAVSIVGILTAIAALGFSGIITREIVKNENESNNILGTAFYLKFFTSLFLLSLIVIYYLLNQSEQTLIVMIVSISLVLNSFDHIEFYFNAKVEAKFPVVIKFISFLLVDTLKILAIIFSLDLIYFAIIFTLEKFILSLGYWIIYRKRSQGSIKWKFKSTRAKQLITDSWPLMFSSIAVTIYMKIDKVLLNELINSEAVGIYDAAVRLCESWYFIPVAISASLFPAIVSAKKKGEEFYKNRMQKFYDLMFLMSFVIALIITIFSSDIINIAYGEKFAAASPVLTIYIWAGIPVFLGNASSQYLVNENFTKISFLRTLVGMITNIALNFILIPIYQLEGSAWATLISYSIATFFIFFFPSVRHQFFMMLKSMLLVGLVKGLMNRGK